MEVGTYVMYVPVIDDKYLSCNLMCKGRIRIRTALKVSIPARSRYKKTLNKRNEKN
jgi:hypothetical protein